MITLPEVRSSPAGSLALLNVEIERLKETMRTEHPPHVYVAEFYGSICPTVLTTMVECDTYPGVLERLSYMLAELCTARRRQTPWPAPLVRAHGAVRRLQRDLPILAHFGWSTS